MERIVKIKKLTDNPHLNLYQEEAVKRNGRLFPYYFASRCAAEEELKCRTLRNDPDGVVLYGVYGEKRDRLVLIRQYRYPVNDYVYELPAGLVERGEEPERAGIREFREETGLLFEPYTGGGDFFRKPFYTTVGMTDESVIPIYGFASGTPSEEHMEESEDIRTVLADRDEVRRILKEERVAMKCALLMMHFLRADSGNPFAFLED